MQYQGCEQQCHLAEQGIMQRDVPTLLLLLTRQVYSFRFYFSVTRSVQEPLAIVSFLFIVIPVAILMRITEMLYAIVPRHSI